MQDNTYTFRGLGILSLCILLVIVGMIRFGESAAAVGSIAGNAPVSSVDTPKDQVALTFQTAGSGEGLSEILAVLEQHQVHATFFVTGTWVAAHPEETRLIANAGHELGNSGETYQDMTKLQEEECLASIQAVHQSVKALTGQEMRIFGLPYGYFNKQVIKSITAADYLPVIWSVDSQDWRDYGVNEIVSAVCQNANLERGAIILCRTNTKYTGQALDQMLTELALMGYQAVTVSSLLTYEAS